MVWIENAEWNFSYRGISKSRIRIYSSCTVKFRLLEYRPIRLVPWNFGTRILIETVLTVEKTIFRKAQFYRPRARIRYAIICGKSESIRKFRGLHTPHFQWPILTSDFPCHGLSPNWNEYSSSHSVDTSHVLEHGTSGYVRILEEYGFVSCDFSFAIRLISHSAGNSHTLLPKRSIYES